MPKLSEKKVRALLGDPSAVAADLEAFQENARRLSSAHPRLIDEYAKQWVAVYDGEVRASARTFEALMRRLEREGIAPERVLVRFIDQNQRTMIL